MNPGEAKVILLRHITLEDEWLLRIPPALERVKARSGEDLSRTIDMLGFMQLPAVDFLSLAVKHSVHHRGQLSAYLRAMDGKVPEIYGPSADTQTS